MSPRGSTMVAPFPSLQSSSPTASVRSLCVGSFDHASEMVAELKASTPTTMKGTPFPSGTVREYDPDAWIEERVQHTVNLWELTADERTKLEELGRRIQDIHHFKNRPADAIRFLKQHSYDVDAAENNFRAMIEWRREFNVDTILRDYVPPKSIADYWPTYTILKGVDHEGDPIAVARTGISDGPGLIKRHGTDALRLYCIWSREMAWHGPWIQQYEEEHQKPVKWINMVDDMHDLQIMANISNRPLMQNFAAMVHMDKDNYPQPVKRLFCIRAPSLIQMAWKLVKHFFHPGVAKKLKFYGHHEYEKGLSKFMDLEILPEEIVPGGKGEARDGFPPKFCGGPVPQEP